MTRVSEIQTVAGRGGVTGCFDAAGFFENALRANCAEGVMVVVVVVWEATSGSCGVE